MKFLFIAALTYVSSSYAFDYTYADCGKLWYDIDQTTRNINGFGGKIESSVIYEELLMGRNINEWGAENINELVSVADQCSNVDATSKQMWHSALGHVQSGNYLDYVKNGLLNYIEGSKRANYLHGQFYDKETSSNGIATSCHNMLNYPHGHRSKLDPNEYYGQPSQDLVGKDFIKFSPDDFSFLEKKIDKCVSILDEFAKHGVYVTEMTSRLRSLHEGMKSWPSIQAEAIKDQDEQDLIEKQQKEKQIEAKRKETDPTILESIAKYMNNAGILGLLVSIAAIPKKDKRFKSGYKDNAKRPAWVTTTFIASIFLMLISSLLSYI
jgi:hypothetical protein